MRYLPLALVACASIALYADGQGRIRGKITNKAGKPVPEAKVSLTQIDINQKRELKVASDGTYSQAGLNPKEFNVVVTAPGYADFQKVVKIPLDNVIVEDIVLSTTKEAPPTTAVVEDPGSAAYSAGRDAYETATPLFQQQKYSEALPLMELAYQNIQESAQNAKDTELKEDARKALVSVERVYAITAAEVGLANSSKRDLFAKATPILEKYVTAGLIEGKPNPKDGSLISALMRIGKETGDKAMEKKYQGYYETLAGPQPTIPYNEGVNAFNAGHMKEAREHVMRAVAVDPKFADSYWLLGVLDFADNKLASAKANLKKYLELAPTGAKAGEVKEMLRELK